MVVHGMNTPCSRSSRSTTILIILQRQIPSRSEDLESLRSGVVEATNGQLPVLWVGMPHQGWRGRLPIKCFWMTSAQICCAGS